MYSKIFKLAQINEENNKNVEQSLEYSIKQNNEQAFQRITNNSGKVEQILNENNLWVSVPLFKSKAQFVVQFVDNTN